MIENDVLAENDPPRLSKSNPNTTMIAMEEVFCGYRKRKDATGSHSRSRRYSFYVRFRLLWQYK